LRGGATFSGEEATVSVGDSEAGDFGDEASGDSWLHAPRRVAMHAADSTQALRVRPVFPKGRFLAARVRTGFMESPRLDAPIEPDIRISSDHATPAGGFGMARPGGLRRDGVIPAGSAARPGSPASSARGYISAGNGLHAMTHGAAAR